MMVAVEMIEEQQLNPLIHLVTKILATMNTLDGETVPKWSTEKTHQVGEELKLVTLEWKLKEVGVVRLLKE